MSETTLIDVDTAAMRERIADVRFRVEAAARQSGRSPDEITIIAVSKTFSRKAVDTAIELGLTNFGENRVQEARQKFETPLPEDTCLRLIGQLQSNKARHAAQFFSCIETVDRLSLIEALGSEAARIRKVLPVLIQVNVTHEPRKSGCAPADAEPLLDVIGRSPHLRCDGLMTIAPLVEDPEDARPTFQALRELRERLQESAKAELPALSMGMSNDFEVAISEGATHIRLGRAIFGVR